MTSIFLNLLRLVLWTIMWSILESVPCTLEKNVYSVALGEVLNPLNQLKSSLMSFKANVSLLIFHLDDLYIDINRMLKSPTILYYC